MKIGDRLYSGTSGEVLYKVLLTGPELSLFSSISEDLGEATAATAGGAAAGALAGKAVKSIKKRGLRGLVSKRALQGATAGTFGGAANTISNLGTIESISGLPQGKGVFVLGNSTLSGTAGGALGALEGELERRIRVKNLKKLIGKGAKVGAAIGGTGYIVHRLSKKRKK